MKVRQEGNRLIIAEGVSQVWIDPWGENSARIRMTKEARMDENDWALTEPVKECIPVMFVDGVRQLTFGQDNEVQASV